MPHCTAQYCSLRQYMPWQASGRRTGIQLQSLHSELLGTPRNHPCHWKVILWMIQPTTKARQVPQLVAQQVRTSQSRLPHTTTRPAAEPRLQWLNRPAAVQGRIRSNGQVDQAAVRCVNKHVKHHRKKAQCITDTRGGLSISAHHFQYSKQNSSNTVGMCWENTSCKQHQ
jgi:hypothetical protein